MLVRWGRRLCMGQYDVDYRVAIQLTQLGDLDVIRSGCDPDNLLGNILASHFCVSLVAGGKSSGFNGQESKTYMDQDRHRRYRRQTCLLGIGQPRIRSLPYLTTLAVTYGLWTDGLPGWISQTRMGVLTSSRSRTPLKALTACLVAQ
jgi:hypothetical protein